MDRSRLQQVSQLKPLNVVPIKKDQVVDPTAGDTRPFMSALYQKHHFDTSELARLANTHESVVLAMLRARPVYRMQAEKVLQALSIMVKTLYDLTNVCVPLIGELENGERGGCLL